MEDLTNPYEIQDCWPKGEWAGQGRGFYPLYVHRYKRSSWKRGRSLRQSLHSVKSVTFETLVLIHGPDADSLLELTD